MPLSFALNGATPWVTVSQHGATGNGVVDDTDAIRSAIAVAAAAGHGGVLFPLAIGYRTTETIEVPVGVEIRMEAPLRYAGDEEVPAVVVGSPGEPNVGLCHVIDVERVAMSDWTNEESAGLVLYNANTSVIEVKRAAGFTVGVRAIGSGGLCGYNRIELGLLLNNKIGLDVTNEADGLAIGSCNENLFLGGRFTTWSTAKPGLSRYGVRITSTAAEPQRNNNNLFLKPSFELYHAAAEPGEAVPVLVEHGDMNRFESSRNEVNGPVFARVSNGSRSNAFDVGNGRRPEIDDTSRNGTSVATGRHGAVSDRPGSLVFASGPIPQHAGPYDGDRIHVPGLHAANSGNASVGPAINDLTLHADFLGIPPSRGLGVFVDTSDKKRFVVRRHAEAGHGGRLVVRCYDDDGAVIGGDPADPLVRGASFAKPDWMPDHFGGSYRQASDSELDRYIAIAPSVAKVAVILAGGTDGDLHLRSFAIFSVDGGNARVWAGYEESLPGAGLAVASPTVGTWETGRMLFNHLPGLGDPLGWVCIAGGTPGSWMPMGAVGP